MIDYVDPETKSERDNDNVLVAQRRHYLETYGDRPDIRHANAYARWHKPLEEWAREIPDSKQDAR